ncbi:MAG: hypothetical protein J5989_06020 [Alistipes sp.]|nr:hypothetical protein [Alistipes sp.]
MKSVIIYSTQNAIGVLVEAMISGCDANFETFQADSTRELLSMARVLRPRLIILLDIVPLLDGCDIVARLHEIESSGRGRLSRSRATIYVITWQQSEHTVLSLLESGIDQYLTFPICIERLRHKVSQQMTSNTLRQ